MMSSITTIINAITYVLIAFVAISLVVSSIMIGVITLISVQERTKEIGILRAIGASKKNVSSMFNAETMIIGFASGLLGVIVTYLLCINVRLLCLCAGCYSLFHKYARGIITAGNNNLVICTLRTFGARYA
jgi:putative ABC transport system permease protein